jgi:hypothetical protein
MWVLFYAYVLIEAKNGVVGGEGIVLGYLYFFFLTVCGTLLLWSYKNREEQNADERASADMT